MRRNLHLIVGWIIRVCLSSTPGTTPCGQRNTAQKHLVQEGREREKKEKEKRKKKGEANTFKRGDGPVMIVITKHWLHKTNHCRLLMETIDPNHNYIFPCLKFTLPLLLTPNEEYYKNLYTIVYRYRYMHHHIFQNERMSPLAKTFKMKITISSFTYLVFLLFIGSSITSFPTISSSPIGGNNNLIFLSQNR